MSSLENLFVDLKAQGISEANPLDVLCTLNVWLDIKASELPKPLRGCINDLFKSCKPAVCPFCKSSQFCRFRYINNKGKAKSIQPRYLCRACHKHFTLGGRTYASSSSSKVARGTGNHDILFHRNTVNWDQCVPSACNTFEKKDFLTCPELNADEKGATSTPIAETAQLPDDLKKEMQWESPIEEEANMFDIFHQAYFITDNETARPYIFH